jgi:hypothetical protein
MYKKLTLIYRYSNKSKVKGWEIITYTLRQKLLQEAMILCNDERVNSQGGDTIYMHVLGLLNTYKANGLLYLTCSKELEQLDWRL